MKLNAPFSISSRLMPALSVDGATLSLTIGSQTPDGRFRYEGWIDLPDGSEWPIKDLCSGVGHAELRDGFSALLSFLSAAAESRRYRERRGRDDVDPDGNEGLFPAPVVDWAAANAEELSMLQCEIDERPGLISE